jgi:hypothetical protein
MRIGDEGDDNMVQNMFPPGWDEERVRALIAHYENQTEDEAVAEDEAAFANEDFTVMVIPKELVPAVQALLVQHQLTTDLS